MDKAVDLDQTDDFMSGATPYKLAASKALARNATKPVKSGRRGLKVSKHGSNNSAARSSSGDRPCGATAEKSLGQIGVYKDANCSSEMDGGLKLKICNCCFKEVPVSEFPGHLKTCLGAMYSRDPQNQLNARQKVLTEDVMCQICQADITDLPQGERNDHVNKCIDSQAPEAGLESEPANEMAAAGDGEAGDGEKCHVCFEDLSAMMASGKLLHINRCVDRKERLKQKQNKPKAARKKVLDCPLCGQPLKTQNSRKIHLKSCARKLNVDPATLMARIKQQQEEESRAGGGGTAAPCPSTTLIRGGKGRRGRPVGGQPRPSCVERVLEEETQLALALSNSMVENETRPAQEAAACNSTDSARAKNAYAILMSPSNKMTVKRGKKKHRNPEYTPALLVENPEEMAKKLARKIAQIMTSSEEGNGISCTPEFTASHVKDMYNGDYKTDRDLQPKGLWVSSAIDPSNVSTQAFYVEKITPPLQVSEVSVGSKISKMSTIAGWSSLQEKDVLDQTRVDTLLNETAVPSTQTAVVLAQLAADQTTLVHKPDVTIVHNASAIGENMQTDKEMSGHFLQQQHHTSKQSTDCDLEATTSLTNPYSISLTEGKEVEKFSDISQFHTVGSDIVDVTPEGSGFVDVAKTNQDDTSRKAIQNLLRCFASLVNNRESSDVTISTADEARLYAHKFLLHARCPEILKSCKKGVIRLESFQKETVLALLRYIYVADVGVPTTHAYELKRLAERFNLPELAEICEEIIERHEPIESGVRGDSEAGRRDKGPPFHTADETLQHVLHEVWGSDSDTSTDEDARADGTSCGGQGYGGVSDEVLGEDEYDDVYKIMTQHKRREEKSSEKSDEEEAENVEDGNDFDDSQSPKNQNVFFRGRGYNNLNMTLHEQMTHALLHGDQMSFESDGGQSESSDQSDSESELRHSAPTNERDDENDGDVSETDSVSAKEGWMCSFRKNEYSGHFDLKDEEEKLKSSQTNTCVQTEAYSCLETPRSQIVRNMSVHSTTPDLFEESPEFDRSLNNEAVRKASFEKTTADRLRPPTPSRVFSPTKNKSLSSPGVIKSNASGRSRVRTAQFANEGYQFKRYEPKRVLRKIHQLSDSGDEPHSGASSGVSPSGPDAESCEIVKELSGVYTDECSSPVLQSQMSETTSSESVDKVKSKRTARNLSDTFSKALGNSLHESSLLGTSKYRSKNTSSLFGNNALYHSSLKYTPKYRRPKEQSSQNSELVTTMSSSTSDIQARYTKRKRPAVDSSSPEVCSKKQRYGSPHSTEERSMDELRLGSQLLSTHGRNQKERDEMLQKNSPPESRSDSYLQVNRTGSQKKCAKVIDLTYESDKEGRGEKQREGSSNEDHRSADSPVEASQQSPMGDNTDVWEGFEDDGFSEMAFDNPLSQQTKQASKDISSPTYSGTQRFSEKTSTRFSEISPRSSQISRSCTDAIENFDLGSSFSESQPSQKCPLTEACRSDTRSNRANKSSQVEVAITKLPSKLMSTSPPKRSSQNLSSNVKSSLYEFKNSGEIGTRTGASNFENPGTSNQAPELRKSRCSDSTSSDSSVQLSDLSDSDEKKKEQSLDGFDPPTDVSGDECEEFAASCGATQAQLKNSFKTPTAWRNGGKKRPEDWVPPSPFTPMPDYASLPTPVIQREADRIGLRRFTKKRAIAVLSNVYHATHTYETDPEFDQEAIEEIRKSNPVKETTDLDPVKNQSKRGKARATKRDRKVQKVAEKVHKEEQRNGTEVAAGRCKKQQGRGKVPNREVQPMKRNPPKRCKDEKKNGLSVPPSSSTEIEMDLSSSSDSRLNTSMENSDREDILEETILHSSPSKGLSKRDVAYKRQQMWEFIMKNDDLYIKILHYEPLEFDEFHTKLKESGLAVGTNIVSEFLDDKGIPYTMRNLRQDKPSRQTKRKTKAKKIPASQANNSQ